jgi:di/tricarboxylate transporter
MNAQMLIVMGLVMVGLILFATEKLRVDMVALILMVSLVVTGVLTPDEGVTGFSNVATVTVAAMFVLSAGVFKSGALNFIGAMLTRLGKWNLWMAAVLMMIAAAAMSAFINDTAVVAILMPVVVEAARKAKVSPSKLLMPLSFASMLGGVCTLIGTSTNILVSSIGERYGEPAFPMFEMARLGVVQAGAGLLYMLLIGIPLIPSRRAAVGLTKEFAMGEYLTEIVLLPEAKSVGMPLGSSPLVKEVEVDVLEIMRGDSQRIPLPRPETVLEAHDVLRVRSNVSQIKTLQQRVGIALKHQANLLDPDLESEHIALVEAVIAPHSTVEGKSLREVKFRTVFDATALAIRRGRQLIHETLDRVPLQAGDALLLEVRRDQVSRLATSDAFVVVSEIGLPAFRRTKILTALAIITGVVLFAALGIQKIVVTAILGSILMILTGCLTLEEAYEAIEWKVIFLLAGVLALGAALEKTGAALLISEVLISTVGKFGPVAIVSALYLLTTLLTNGMSNNATAALLAPIAIGAARSVGFNPRPFMMAVTFAASGSFMTPVGYQTNTMIYTAGQYRFSDFVRVGVPLNLGLWILSTFLIPRIWRF